MGNQSQIMDHSPKVDSENTYQPLIPPRRSKNTTVTSSLGKVDKLENLKLQYLGNQPQPPMPPDQNLPKVESENTYQPLIPPRYLNNNNTSTIRAAGEYQSLTQL